jgi:LuxR family maltose regulon positive regulatory protein
MVWERLQFGLAALPLLSADLASASHEAQIFLDEGERTGNIYVVTWGEYLQGIIAFHYHDLKVASEHFSQIARNRYVAHQRMVLDSLIGLAVAAEMLGEPGAAEQWIREARDYARWAEVEAFAEHALSCEARIALLRGDLDSAVRWQRGLSLPPPAAGMLWFVGNPWVTECRVLVAQGTVAALSEAADKLHRLRQKTDAFHYACQTMEILVLQALVADGQGRRDESLDVLQDAVDLAEPGGWIRPFVEPGTAMVPLLQQLLERNPAAAHARRILAAFPTQPLSSTGVQSSPAALSEPLTWRQEQVLNLLADRLRNKEISARLNISPQTVKAHLRAIYEKLGARTRREAVEKSRELGIVD